MLYSFDIFDIVFNQVTANQKGVFAVMKSELESNPKYKNISSHVIQNFFELRIHSEEFSRFEAQCRGIEEITLAQIYKALATTGDINTETEKMLCDLESQIFCESICINEMYCSKIKKLLEHGERIILIADTYYDMNTIQHVLLNVDKNFLDFPIYLSSVYKVCKKSGELYKKIKEIEQVEYSDWLHYGSNYHDDCQITAEFGMKFQLIESPGIFPIEQKSLIHKEQDTVRQVVIGVARNIRNKMKNTEAGSIGCSIGGPILYFYVQWIIEACLKHGIKRLYFIARDGFVPKNIFDIIAQNQKNDITSFYIYGSRKAWRLPSYSGCKGELIKLVEMSYIAKLKTLNDLAILLTLDIEDLLKFLPNEYKNDCAELSVTAMRVYVRILDDNKLFRELLFDKLRKKREITKKYLLQELDMSDDNFAFVEISGTGITQACLAKLIKAVYPKPIKTFFFQMDRMLENNNCVYYNFLPSKLENCLIIELLSRATHEQVCGYRESLNNVIIPFFDGNEGQCLKEYGYSEYIYGVELFCKEYAYWVKLYNLPISMDLVVNYLEFIMKSPDLGVLNFFSNMPHGASGRENKMNVFAPILTKKNIRDIFLFHPKQSVAKYYEGADIDYSKHRCSKVERKKIEFYQKNRVAIIARLQNLTKRSFGELNKDDNLFKGLPYSYFGNRFVIYGAGKWGSYLYEALSTDYKVVQWLDQNYPILRERGIAVTGILSDIRNEINYDKIFIALSDIDIAKKIRRELLVLGIDQEDIVMLYEYVGIFDIDMVVN